MRKQILFSLGLVFFALSLHAAQVIPITEKLGFNPVSWYVAGKDQLTMVNQTRHVQYMQVVSENGSQVEVSSEGCHALLEVDGQRSVICELWPNQPLYIAGTVEGSWASGKYEVEMRQ